MSLISKLPGPLLVFLGAFCLSFGGLIVKSFEGATLWQILFWRQLFFILLGDKIFIDFYILRLGEIFIFDCPKKFQGDHTG